jgi:hypothetical protein
LIIYSQIAIAIKTLTVLCVSSLLIWLHDMQDNLSVNESKLTRETFAKVSSKPAAPVSQQLHKQDSVLLAIAERVRLNFYQFVEDHRLLSESPEQPMRDMTVEPLIQSL